MQELTLSQKLHKDRDSLLRFCAAHPVIRIFGAGDLAILFYRYLTEEGIAVTDFIMPDDRYTGQTFLGLPAVMFSKASFSGEDGIILAVESWMQGFVVFHLAEKNVFSGQICQQTIYGQYTDMTDNCALMLPGYTGNDAPDGYFKNFTELNETGKRYGTDKSDVTHNYLNKYEFFLRPWKECAFTLLELGIFKGDSIRMWRDFFPKAKIVGVDYDPSCAEMGDERMEVVIADLSLMETLQQLRDYKPEIIIDDASHIWSHQIKSLCTLYDVLPHGGIFIMEDLETSFPVYRYQNYDDAPLSCYAFLSAVAEVVTGGECLETEYRRHIYELMRPEIEEIAMQTEMMSFIHGSCLLIRK